MSKLQAGAVKENGTPYTLEEIKSHNDFVDLVQTAVKEQTANMISKEEADAAIENATKGLTNELQEKYNKLYEAAIKQGQTLANLRAQGAPQSEIQSMQKQLMDRKDELNKSVATKSNHNFILKTEYARTGVTSNPMGMMLPEIGIIGAPKLGLYDIFPKISVDPESNGVVRYIDQTTGTRNAAAVAESAAYVESAIAFTGYSLNLQKIGGTIPITEEVLRYTSRLHREIELLMQTDVMMAVESNLATGNNTPPNLNGIYTAATTYTASAAGVVDCTIYDLLVKMSEDITGNTTYGGKYTPDFAIMNISDINKMRLKKDANNQYVIPPFASQDGKNVAGITVIESPFITANTLVMGDRRFARIYEEGTLEQAYNYVNADFLQDVITLKLRKFLALLVRNADATGFRKCTDIATDMATLQNI